MKAVVMLFMIAFTLFQSASAYTQEAMPHRDTDADTSTNTEVVESQLSLMEAAGLQEAAQLAIRELEKPVITPGPAITLGEALKKAEARNLDLESAKIEIEKAKAGLSKSWGLVLPYVQAQLEYTHMDHADEVDLADSISSSLAPMIEAMAQSGMLTPTQIAQMTGSEPLLTNPQDKLSGAVQVMLPLINPEAWLKIRTAQKGVEVATLSIESARRQLLLGTAQAYFMVLAARDLIELHFSQMETAQEQLRVSNARFNAGKAMRIDVIRAETDFEQARQLLLSALLSFDNSRDTLGRLVGINGLPLPADSPTLVTLQGEGAKLEERAASRRADVKADSAKRELLERQKKAVWGQFLPKLDMAWQGSYQFTDLPDLGSNDRSRSAFVFTLTIPLYNHFRYAELNEKRAAIRQAELNLENTRQNASLAVRKARRDYANALAAVTIAEKQTALAREGVELMEAAYRNGRGTSLDVTLARQTHTAAGLNLTTSQLRAQLALLSLLDAVGEDIPKQIQ